MESTHFHLKPSSGLNRGTAAEWPVKLGEWKLDSGNLFNAVKGRDETVLPAYQLLVAPKPSSARLRLRGRHSQSAVIDSMTFPDANCGVSGDTLSQLKTVCTSLFSSSYIKKKKKCLIMDCNKVVRETLVNYGTLRPQCRRCQFRCETKVTSN